MPGGRSVGLKGSSAAGPRCKHPGPIPSNIALKFLCKKSGQFKEKIRLAHPRDGGGAGARQRHLLGKLRPALHVLATGAADAEGVNVIKFHVHLKESDGCPLELADELFAETSKRKTKAEAEKERNTDKERQIRHGQRQPFQSLRDWKV